MQKAQHKIQFLHVFACEGEKPNKKSDRLNCLIGVILDEKPLVTSGTNDASSDVLAHGGVAIS